MLSPEFAGFDVIHWAEQEKQSLQVYSDKIESCIVAAEWETLAIVLESRHAHLQQLFLQPLPDQCLKILKQIAESILQQDKLFQVRVETEKQIIAQQRMSIENGRRAMRAYNNQ